MTIDITTAPFQTMVTNFSKTLTRTPITKTTSNLTGDETLTEGTPESISGTFFRKEDEWMLDKAALIDNADAILLVLPAVTIEKDDKITYDNEDYRIDKVITRKLATITFHKMARLFKI